MISKKIKMMSALAAVGFTVSMLYPCANVYAANASSNTIEPVKRLSGSNRYATSVEISKDGWKDGAEYIVIASGQDFPDALCASPLAKKYNAPILLTKKDSLSSETKEEIKRLNAKHVFIVGGKGAVSQTVENEIKKANSSIAVERLEGANRYETAVKVANKVGSNKVVVVSGKTYADALSVASIAAEKGMPILLTGKDNLPKEVQDFVKGKNVGKAYIIGQTGVVSSNIEKQFKNVERFGGQDRYATNAEVLKAFGNEINFQKVYAAVGGPKATDFADALSGSAAAAKSSSPVILTSKTLPRSVKEFTDRYLYPSTEVVALGGESVLPEESVNSMQIHAKVYSKDGQTEGSKDSSKKEEIGENIEVVGNNITVQNESIDGNVYVEGNKDTIKNVKVNGTLYVDPGKTGISNLQNVEADSIKILSGAKDSIHLKDVKADLVEVASKDAVRVVVEGKSEIKQIKATSSAIVEVQSGTSLEKVEIEKSTQEGKVVTLKGHIREVVVDGSIKQLVLADNAVIGRITAKVNVEVKAGSNVEVKELQVASGVKVTPADKNTKLPEAKPIDSTEAPKTDTTGGSSSSSSSSSRHHHDSDNDNDDEDKTQTSVDLNANIEVNENLAKMNAQQLFDAAKDKGNANHEAVVDLFTTAFNKASGQKEEAKTKLGITSSNAKTIKEQLLAPFGITDVEKPDMNLAKELLDNLRNDKNIKTVDDAVNTMKNYAEDKEFSIPSITTKNGTYKASKVTVTVGTESISTGTTKDGVYKENGNVKLDYDQINKLMGKVKNVLGNKDLNKVTLNDLIQKLGNKATVITEFTNDNGEKLTVKSNLTVTVK
ncbi:cell wall-binding repeat-containing protein [Haloimpatiens sp. FM7330]|uniref:cell wall-binding repeat-containing protein n=1 Tax=Haloimpatiens sp. FM7330 TaxID=3298610 RepID=UPI00362ABB2C